jgi:PAS domain S-box-containing protein
MGESDVSKRLRILHLEDEPDFCTVVRSFFEQENLDAELVLVATRREFEAALAREKFDVILADYLLPSYNGLEALKWTRTCQIDTPFLIVSGTIGEEAAIESLKNGATDYVLKLCPERLVPAIRRAVEEAEEKKRRKKVETELIRRERYFRTLTENSLDIVMVMNRDGLLVYNSPSVKRVLGYDPRELAGRCAFDLAHPEDRARVRQEFDQGLMRPEQTVTLEFRFQHQTGSWRFLEAVGQNRLGDPEIGAVVMNSRDVTERKRLEHRDSALSNLGKSLSSATTPEDAAEIIRAITDTLFQWDAFTLDLYSTEHDLVYPTLNVDTEREGKRFTIPAKGQGKPPSAMARRVITTGGELILRQEPIVMPGDVVPIGDTSRPSASLVLVPIRNRTKVIGVLSIQSYKLNAYEEQDLNTLQVLADHCGGALERIRAETELREREMLFHSIWENSVDGMRLTNEEGTIVGVNEAFCKLVGMPRAELEGELFTAVYADSQNQEMLQKYQRRFREREVEKQVERRLTLRNGQVVVFENRNSFVELSGRAPLLLGLFRDVTGQKRLEEQFRQSQKMEAIGQLAGGVAHDFNNILTVIQGHASILRDTPGLEKGCARSADQIGEAAERAASLTRQLLTFSRRQVMQPRCLDLNEVVSNMTKMLSRILGEDITLQLSYSTVPALVHADASMIEQVLLNLAVNSRDAMPKGGQLTIRIGVADIDRDEVADHPDAQTGRFVCLHAIDTGCGIPGENLRRIFEPFFTTKEIGKGTGLGLATVYGIVNQHHGWVEAESQVGKGTTFRVYLPSTNETAASQEASGETSIRGGTETILVVEDEWSVRELVCHLLKAKGYKVLQAESGAQALNLWQSTTEKIDLVLTDLVMPDRVNGRELAERLWAEKPKLKVIFTSGYSADVVGRDFVLRSGLNYLQKPYHPNQLASVVRDCLDAVN